MLLSFDVVAVLAVVVIGCTKFTGPNKSPGLKPEVPARLREAIETSYFWSYFM
jgi:hypothetical protein